MRELIWGFLCDLRVWFVVVLETCFAVAGVLVVCCGSGLFIDSVFIFSFVCILCFAVVLIV